MNDITIHFEGPYSLAGGERSLFHAACASSPGVYLWTFKQDSDSSYMIHYVGETISFAKRHREHLVHILSLNYGLFDPDKAKRGVCSILWEGLWRDRSADGPAKLLDRHAELALTVRCYVECLDIFFAGLDVDRQTRKHVEGAIGWNLRNRYPAAKILYPDDNHIGISRTPIGASLHITATETIQGLDTAIPI